MREGERMSMGRPREGGGGKGGVGRRRREGGTRAQLLVGSGRVLVVEPEEVTVLESPPASEREELRHVREGELRKEGGVGLGREGHGRLLCRHRRAALRRAEEQRRSVVGWRARGEVGGRAMGRIRLEAADHPEEEGRDEAARAHQRPAARSLPPLALGQRHELDQLEPHERRSDDQIEDPPQAEQPAGVLLVALLGEHETGT